MKNKNKDTKIEPKLVTPTDLARLCSETGNAITKQAAHKAVTEGKIPHVLVGKRKMVDLNDREVQSYINSQSWSRENKAGVKQRKPEKQAIPSDIEHVEIPEYLKKIAENRNLNFNDIASLTKVEIEKIKLYEQVKSIRVKTQKERQQLVSRKLIRVVFGKLYEIDVNEFLTLKNKIVPDLAGIMGCTDPAVMLEAEKKIDEELWKVLKHIQHELNKFLKTINEDDLINDSE